MQASTHTLEQLADLFETETHLQAANFSPPMFNSYFIPCFPNSLSLLPTLLLTPSHQLSYFYGSLSLIVFLFHTPSCSALSLSLTHTRTFTQRAPSSDTDKSSRRLTAPSLYLYIPSTPHPRFVTSLQPCNALPFHLPPPLPLHTPLIPRFLLPLASSRSWPFSSFHLNLHLPARLHRLKHHSLLLFSHLIFECEVMRA